MFCSLLEYTIEEESADSRVIGFPLASVIYTEGSSSCAFIVVTASFALFEIYSLNLFNSLSVKTTSFKSDALFLF